MLHKPYVATAVVSLFLVVYIIFSRFAGPGQVVFYMFLASPVFVAWMVITVLKYGRYDGKTLDGREFGYQDKDEKNLADVK